MKKNSFGQGLAVFFVIVGVLWFFRIFTYNDGKFVQSIL